MTGLGVGIGVGVGNNIGNAGDGSALFLNFLANSLDSRVTFTRASTAYRVNASGILESVANDVPRFDYNPTTLLQRGLLIEEGRTNLALRSQEFDNGSWAQNGLIGVSPDVAVAPNNTTTADKLVENTSNVNHFAIQAYTKAASALSYTFSCWVKSAERNFARLSITDNGGNSGVFVNFNLSTGATLTQGTFGGGWTVQSSRIEQHPNGWWRCIIRGTSQALTDLNTAIRLSNDGSGGVYLGDGVSGIFVWGAQLEQAEFETSYIPTTSGSAARSEDTALITGGNFSGFFNATAGTILVVGTSAPLFVANQDALLIDDNTTNEAYFSRRVSGPGPLFQVNDGGVIQASIGAGSWSNLTRGGMASAYAVNDFATSFNGGAVQTDAAGTLPTVTQMQIGRQGAGANYWNGWIERIEYWNTRLSNGQLQALTA